MASSSDSTSRALNDRLTRLERASIVLAQGEVRVGLRTLEDDFHRKLTTLNIHEETRRCIAMGVWDEARSDSSQASDSRQSSDQTLHEWGRSFTEASWRQFLAERGLSRLEDTLSFVRGEGLASADEVARQEVLTLAYWIVRCAELGDRLSIRIKESRALAFEFTYGMTWEEAAEALKKRLGR